MGLGGVVCRQGQWQGELRALSDVDGMAAGVVRCDTLGSSCRAIALLRCSALPTVGKFSEIIPNAAQASQLGNSLSASLVTNNLTVLEGMPGWGSARESQDDGTKYLYSDSQRKPLLDSHRK